MRGLSVLCSLVVAVGCCLIAFSSVCIEAHASEPVFRQMSISEAYSFYGDSIDIVYYSQTGYKHATLTHSNSFYYVKCGNEFVGNNVPSWLNNSSLQYCQYSVSLSDYSADPTYLGVNISPNVHFSDCNALRFCAGAYLANTTVSSAAYNSSFIQVRGQTELRYENSSYTDGDVFPYWRVGRTSSVTGDRILPVWCDYVSDTLLDVSLLQIGFNGARLSNGTLYIYLSCPLINDSAVGGTGVVTGTTVTTSPAQSGDITVNVDMQETNGILGRILQAISNLVDAIAGLFVPDSEFLDEWCDNMQELLEDHLGGAYDAIGMLVDLIESLYHPSSVGSISCPTVSLPGGLTLGGWTLNLQVQGAGFTVLYTGLAWIIDFIVTMAFLKTCRKKVEIFLNPDSEVVSNDN